MTSARDELIDVQKRWVRDLKKRIYDAEGRNAPELDRYYDEYRELFQHGFERVATRAELVRQISLADIVYVGDYHTLKIAQQTVATLLDETASDYGRKMLLGLEMLRTEHQRYADDYLAGRMEEREFLDAIAYDKTWGFPWPSYRALFDVARKRGFKIIGLNSAPDVPRKMQLGARDQNAAEIIAAAAMIFPGHTVAVLFGDLHVGETHLPKRVRGLLAARGISRHDLIVYQNSETFYWKLVGEGKEQVVDAVKVKRGIYCVMAATPLVKFQSHLNWQENAGELEFTGLDALGHEYRGLTDLTQQFADVVSTIAKFLRIEAEGLDDFTLYTTGDLDFLGDLKKHRVYSPEEINDLRKVIAQQHSAFFARARTVYLGSLSINDAAEMAAKFIRFNCTHGEFEGEHSAKDAFYVAAFDEALGVVGAMIINSRYRVATLEDHLRVLAETRGKRLAGEERIERDVSDAVVQHVRMVRRMLENEWAQNSLRAIYHMDAERFRRVTRALGAILGAQMFAAVNAGKMSKSEVRDLFFETWGAGEPFRKYVAFKRRFLDLPDDLRALRDSL